MAHSSSRTVHPLHDRRHSEPPGSRPCSTRALTLARRLWGLVAGIRPSLIAGLGLTEYGQVDHLNATAQATWRVSMELLSDDVELARLEPDVSAQDDALFDAMSCWLGHDLHGEATRWTIGESMVRHLRLVIDECPNAHDLHLKEGLVRTWRDNLIDLRRAIHAGDVTIGPVGAETVESLRASLEFLPGLCPIELELALLADQVDHGAPAVPPQPMLAELGQFELLDVIKQTY